MKPIHHPSINDITVEGILHALADPVRVRILAGLQTSTCPQTCSTFLELGNITLPKSTLSQHFKVLREAGLIRSERKGVEMHNTTRCEELQDKFGPLLIAIIESYAAQNKKTGSVKK